LPEIAAGENRDVTIATTQNQRACVREANQILPASAASFAKWLGATDAELDAILPNLNRFAARALDLFA